MEDTTKRSPARTGLFGPRPLLGMAAGMGAVAALGHAFLPGAGLPDPPLRLTWWWLALTFAVFEAAVVVVRVQRNPHTVTLSDVPLVLGLALASPGALIVGRLLGGLAVSVAQRRDPWKVVFNAAMHYLETVVAVLVLHAVAGGAGPTEMRLWLALLAAHLVGLTVTGLMLAWGIRLADRRRRFVETLVALSAGFAISAAAGLAAVLYLLALWVTPFALVFVAAATAGLYAMLVMFGRLSDRHSELISVHSFSTKVAMKESDETLSKATLHDLADTFNVDLVEVAAYHRSGGGRRWMYARLEGGAFTTEPGDAAALEALIERVAGTGVVRVSSLDGAAAGALRDRGSGDGLLNGFRPNGLAGYILVGGVTAAERSLSHLLPLFGTLTASMVSNLERVTLIDHLRAEVAAKDHERVHDALTGLLNRAGFGEALHETLAADDGRLAVAIVDLDRFQDVNDVFGPDRGDAVLVEVAERLREGIRRDDLLARVGGDEFAVLFREVRADAAVALSRRISDAFLDPFVVGDVPITLSASTGIAVYPDHGDDADTLLRRADMARTIAKAARHSVQVFDFEQDLAAERRLMLANDLRPAIERGEVTLEFQPKLEMATGRTIGFEALARWTHPQLGRIAPPEFIAIAQQSGLITPLSLLVLDQAVEQVALWRERDPAISVAVNVAAEALVADDFADRVRDALDRRGLPPDALILEVTESQSLAEDRRTRDTVLRLAASGVLLSIDDFGTRYAALSYLQNLPAGEVKIDRSFVDRMAEHPGDRAIVEGTIKLLHSVGLRVVAEGVESREVWDLLAGLGCYAAQGYWMSKPLPPAEALAWVVEPSWALEGVPPA
ncbi:MAG: bifunctional diguanylate cyclase/phosphodiesterase [Actinobacteria bacterium]|nr:bifunctional diguanylate cyclase/phosphodiesterase [Actinomycetota bacterium]